MKKKNIDSCFPRENLIGEKYLRVFYKGGEKLPFFQGSNRIYLDIFESRDDLKTKTTFVFPSAKKPFETKSLLPLKKRKFGEIYLWTPNNPYAHLSAEFGKKDGPDGYMNKIVGASFNHRKQIPSFCYLLSKPIKK
jgi:hypothetical protein